MLSPMPASLREYLDLNSFKKAICRTNDSMGQILAGQPYRLLTEGEINGVPVGCVAGWISEDDAVKA